VKVDNTPVCMIRTAMNGLPGFKLPPPYRLRGYRAGDEEAWVRIHEKADAHGERTIETFRSAFGSDTGSIAQRQFYLLDGEANPAGTATAWFDSDFADGQWGRVHWVAILPEHQKRGLAKPLLARVMLRLKEMGHARAFLTTQAMRLPAIHLYLNFGFLPYICNDEERAAWHCISAELDHPALRALAF
jgi:GNAT superfamily N-acetyltransferase